MQFKKAFCAFFRALKEPAAEAISIEKKGEKSAPSHLTLLQLLQGSSRLIDFLKEDIRPFSDAEVGAAVRKIHADCSRCLEELVTIRAVLEENEGEEVEVPEGYDPASIKVVGNVKGKAPFRGKLVHKGWRAHKRSLPKRAGELPSDIIQPAEVEVK